MCRKDNSPVGNRTWCGQWTWEVEPRVNWTSAFATVELQLAHEADLEAELAKSVASAENPAGRPAPPNWQPDPFTPFEFGRHVPPGETPFFEMLD